MPDLDAIDDLTRLPAAASGGLTTTLARPPADALAPGTGAGTGPSAAPSGGNRHGRALALLRYLDVVVVVVAAAPALSLGAPALGYLVASVAWVAQRVLAELDRRWIGNAAQPHRQLGLGLFEAFGRIWLLAGAIVLAGVLGGRADGLTAALVIFVAYSIVFCARLISGRPQEPVR
jgi:hypothetical protein